MARSVLIALVLAVFALYLCEAQQTCQGGPHDVVTECGSHCEPSCSKPDGGPCILSCAINVCRCENGFYRRESDQQCVSLNECNSQPTPL